MVLTPDEISGDCPECGGYMEQMTTNPMTVSGRCEIWLVCEECGHEMLAGSDSVL